MAICYANEIRRPGLSRVDEPMIGVVARSEQAAAVEEFFELFKTPWEFHRSGQAYDVVVATTRDVSDVNARLLVVYGADRTSIDVTCGTLLRSRHRGGSLRYRSLRLPVYGDLATFDEGEPATPCVSADNGVAGMRCRTAGATVLRLGFDLFDEVGHLLSAGQPPDNAHVPTLDLHIAMLRSWIIGEGIPLVEIPPIPAGYKFAVCLTHDIDFGGIRSHRLDHTMWGFLYRSTVGAVRNLLRGRLSMAQLFHSWRAAASLPFVFMGWAKDFWNPFDWYLAVERGLRSTYFVIPFKGRPGERVTMAHASRRAASYELSDLAPGMKALLKEGCELAVHGIDAWHSVEKGRAERKRIADVNGESSIGVRMHWLLRDENTFRVLEEAGFTYDSTAGYNETIGYRSGTTQVFLPTGARTLLELPLHIQDGAMFYPDRLDLSEPEAWRRCERLIDHAKASGGVLTTLWHDRSPAPDRLWGDFYVRLVGTMRSLDVWFARACDVVGWFQARRNVRFERVDTGGDPSIRLIYDGEDIHPPLRIRMHWPAPGHGGEHAVAETKLNDIVWNGSRDADADARISSRRSTRLPSAAVRI
jgi:peptidoglycan/xylan/chitin deacetylase (PgdA/CDA1 family)